MRIGILECGDTPARLAAIHGSFPQMFARLFRAEGWSFPSFAVKDGVIPPPDAAQGWILTGSRHGAYEDHAFIPPLERLLQAAMADRQPVIGICFGHQILAQAMGGRVEKAPQGWQLGPQAYDFDGLGTVRLHAWHQDQVSQVPPGAQVVARAPDCPVAALRYGSHAVSVQAHPEFDDPALSALIAARRADPAYPPERIAAAERALGAPLDRDRIARWMADCALGRGVAADRVEDGERGHG